MVPVQPPMLQKCDRNTIDNVHPFPYFALVGLTKKITLKISIEEIISTTDHINQVSASYPIFMSFSTLLVDLGTSCFIFLSISIGCVKNPQAVNR